MKKEKKEILIQKKSGETEPFDVSKLKASLRKAGAADDVIEKIAADIENRVYDGVTTDKIYAHAYKMFRRQSGNQASRYKLKKSLFSMGPTGYPFEYLIGEIFKRQGYKVEVGQVVDGVTITHEIDVIATKNGEQHLMECKFTRDQGNRLSVQVPLYVHSRVNDIVEKRRQQEQYKNLSFTPWVVTNARFSSDSMEYSKCKGLKLLG
ncbi:MAG: ATP cone domain-containing protein, partial [Bacteroidales bacterium]